MTKPTAQSQRATTVGRPSMAPTRMIRAVDDRPQAPSIEPFALSLREAAAYVGLHYQTLYEEVKAGKLVSKKFGAKHLLRRVDLEAWFDRLPDSTTDERVAS